jgi:hypothetical protein
MDRTVPPSCFARVLTTLSESKNWKMKAIEAMQKANALDFARRIDELRCLLVESAPEHYKK